MFWLSLAPLFCRFYFVGGVGFTGRLVCRLIGSVRSVAGFVGAWPLLIAVSPPSNTAVNFLACESVWPVATWKPLRVTSQSPRHFTSTTA